MNADFRPRKSGVIHDNDSEPRSRSDSSITERQCGVGEAVAFPLSPVRLFVFIYDCKCIY